MENNGFYKILLPLEKEVFTTLSHSAEFEDVAKGRKGNHLVDPGAQGVPIVRTTTRYEKAANTFSGIHHAIAKAIRAEVKRRNVLEDTSLQFNNALIEIYDDRYSKMKYHSDQALDLEANSCIALFSCYERPSNLTEKTVRKLKIQNKATFEEFEFTLENNSVMLFSVATNSRFQHKIVMEAPTGFQPTEGGNRWLGMTFRQSKTWIQFKHQRGYFPNGELLTLADTEQAREFYQLRGQENNALDFEYPDISYTLSMGDTREPREI
ncbi:MAG: hypothetical protein RLZZ519_1237 [Bacteroidota bacterium]|jgi:hypothetical protein